MSPMEQASSSNRLGRSIADMQGNDEDRARLLGRLAVGLAIATALGAAVLAALELLGLLAGQNLIPTMLFSAILMGAIAGVTYWLTQKKRFTLATNIFLYSTVLYVTLLIYLIGASGPLFVAYLIPVMAAGLFGKTGDGLRIFVVALV